MGLQGPYHGTLHRTGLYCAAPYRQGLQGPIIIIRNISGPDKMNGSLLVSQTRSSAKSGTTSRVSHPHFRDRVLHVVDFDEILPF